MAEGQEQRREFTRSTTHVAVTATSVAGIAVEGPAVAAELPLS